MSSINWPAMIPALLALVTAVGNVVKLIAHQRTSENVHKVLASRVSPSVESGTQADKPSTT